MIQFEAACAFDREAIFGVRELVRALVCETCLAEVIPRLAGVRSESVRFDSPGSLVPHSPTSLLHSKRAFVAPFERTLERYGPSG